MAQVQTQIVLNFVSILRELLVDLARRRPNDEVVDRARKRLNLAADMIPVDVVEITGPYLYKYRDVIYAEDLKDSLRFFNDPNCFDEDLQSAEDASRRDIAAALIPKVQQIARQMDQKTQKVYIGKVQDLLDLYLDFLV